MTTKDEALDLALEALEGVVKNCWRDIPSWRLDEIKEHITAIKQARSAPVQEPVAWMFEFPDKRVRPRFDSAPHGGNWQPLYTHPQPDAYGYAKRLAEAIWKKHYQSTAPQWEPFDHLIGVLTQIDNMTSGLTTPPNVATPLAAQPAVPLTDEQIYAIGKELGMKCLLGGNPNIDLDYARAIEAAHGIKEKGQP